MGTVARLVRSYPLSAYVVLAYALSIALGLLLNVSMLFGLIALFGPALAAFVVSRMSRGRAGTTELMAVTTRWRVPPGWYLAAIGLPLAGFAVGYLIYLVGGNAPLAVPGAVEPILFVLFFLVIGEEIGWRGFLLNGLLRRHSPLFATLIVAIVWAFWHSPLYFIPGMPSYGQPFWAFALWVVPVSFLLTWLWLGTRSVWLATFMHGSSNIGASLVFPHSEPAPLFVYSAIGLALVAAPLVLLSWARWTNGHAGEPVPQVVPTGGI